MKALFDYIKNRWVTVWLVLVAVALASVCTYAAYLSGGYAKRVISTRNNIVYFSSNYMDLQNRNDSEELYSERRVSFATETGVARCDILVNNFDSMNPNEPSPYEIVYNFRAELYDLKGNKITSGNSYDMGNGETVSAETLFGNATIKVGEGEATLRFTDAADHIVAYNNVKMQARTPVTNQYQLSIKAEYAPYVRVKLEAIPAENSVGSLKRSKLAVFLNMSNQDVSTDAWSGNYDDSNILLPEKLVERDATKKLSGFNYTVSGTGSGIVTLSWNKNYVELSSYQQEYLKTVMNAEWITTESQWPKTNWAEKYPGMVALQFSVGAADQGIYRLQFYRTKLPDANECWNGTQLGVKQSGSAVWDAEYIICEFTKSS